MQEINLCDYLDPDNWVTKPTHTYKRREPWFPLSDAVSIWDDEFHHLMLHDRLRMETFKNAIDQTVTYLFEKHSPSVERPLRILDIGTGHGILSYWIVKAARAITNTSSDPDYQTLAPVKVYAVEGNPVTVGKAYNNLSAAHMLWGQEGQLGEILVLACSSYKLSQNLADTRQVIKQFDPLLYDHFGTENNFKSFDLIVSETLGNIGDNEDIVCILNHAIKEFLTEQGVVMPSRVRSFLVPVESEPTQAEPGHLRRFNGLGIHKAVADRQYQRINDQYVVLGDSSQYDQFYDAIIPLEDYLSTPTKLQEWRFSGSEEILELRQQEYKNDLSFEAERSGWVSGFKGFFKAELTDHRIGRLPVELDIEGDCIEEGKTSDCWKHLYLPVKDQVYIEKGDQIILKFERKYDLPDQTPKYSYYWEGHINRGETRLGAFQHHHEITTPFMPPQQSLTDRLVQAFTHTLESTHLFQTVLIETNAEANEVLKHSLNNHVWEGLMRLGRFKDLGNKQKFVKETFDNYIGEQSGNLLKNCLLAFPSSDGKKPFILVSASDRLVDVSLEGAWAIHYKVDPSAPVEKIVTVQGQPYDEVKMKEAFVSASGVEGGFLSVLIIPKDIFLDLSWSNINDLPNLMYFLQIRIFVDILSWLSQRRQVYSHLYRMTHELKQLADAFSTRWLIDPNKLFKSWSLSEELDSTTETASRVKISEVWKDINNWRIIPFPDLIESIGRMYKLWSGYNSPHAIFSQECMPSNVEDWINACWQIAINNVKVIAGWNESFIDVSGIKAAKDRFDWIDNRLPPALKTSILPNKVLADPLPWKIEDMEVNGEEISRLTANWMRLTKWMITVMSNYVRHGVIIDNGLYIEVVECLLNDVEIVIFTAKNQKRPLHNSSLPSWFPSKEGKSITKTLTAMRGEEIQKDLAHQLDTNIEESDSNSSDYYIKLPVRKDLLWL